MTTGLGSVLKKLELDGKLVELRVKAAWRDAVGDGIARRAVPTELERSTLHLTVESPAWENELRFVEKDVLFRVNQRYRELTPGSGLSPVKQLKMHRGVLPPLPPRPKPPEDAPVPTDDERRRVEARLTAVQDPELREAARELLLQTLIADRPPRK
jgi:hypothetical protein